MKIGILTYHFAINYGAVLQCYALQQTLHEMGYDDVEIINYNTYNWRLLLQNLPHRFSYELFHKAYIKFSHYNSADNVFRKFVDSKLCCSSKVNMSTLPELAKKYDAIIVGSDQVWAPRMREGSPYFLNWKPGEYEGKRIAYAPCCMIKKIQPSQISTLTKALNAFDSLSVRDDETRQFVSNLTGESPVVVPDPTFLYDFAPVLRKKPVISEPYIFAYVLGADIPGSNKDAIRRLRNMLPGTKVYAVTLSKTNPVDTAWADKVIYDASPEDWLNYVQFAKLVFTDSFHAAVFSMKFHTPFFAYYSMPSRKPRFDDMVKRFGIERNIISSVDQILMENISVFNNDVILEKQKMVGVSFLKKSLIRE